MLLRNPIRVALGILGGLLCSAAFAQTLPSFPGAEGFGARATGGRGGSVLKVNTLAASGPGSLQWAIDQPGPRIVVFTVSGVINGDIEIGHGDLTIAGQTAPGAGITIAGHLYTPFPTSFGNLVIRHLRVRPPMPDSNWPPEQHDAVQFSANQLLMLDHVDFSHSVDEILDLYDGARDISVQWSNLSFSVYGGGHPDGAGHNFGMLNGPNGGRISVHHNLFAHNRARSPAISYGPAEVINNVVYNAREGFVHHNPAVGQFNLIGNTYKDGPSGTLIPMFFDPENEPPPSAYHVGGNRVIDPGVFEGIVDNPFTTPGFGDAYGFYCCGIEPAMFANASPFPYGGYAGRVAVTVQNVDLAYAEVLAKAGAWPRDRISQWSVEETANRTGSWGNRRPSNWMEGLTAGTAPLDSDGDAMPDSWELGRGLNPNSAADVHQVLAGGYPAVETWINEMADALIGAAAASLFLDGFE